MTDHAGFAPHQLVTTQLVGALLESSPEAMLVVNADGVVLASNSECELLLRYPHGGLEGTAVEELVPQRYRQGHVERRRRYSEEPSPRPMGAGLELVAVCADGFEVPVEVSLHPLGEPGDGLVSVALRDVTDERGERARRLLLTLVENTDDAIIAATLQGVITHWNPGAQRVFGYSADEMIGRSFRALVPEELEGEVREILAHLAGGNRIAAYETVRVRKDGSRVDVSLSVAPLVDRHGRVVGVATIGRDISERKRLEAKLRHLADHDELTGLFNRRRFQQELDQELAMRRRYGSGGAVLEIDLDHLKEVNDVYGHGAGDEMIKRSAAVISDRLRETDVVARLGGDEFAAILRTATPDEAATVAQELIDALATEARVDPSFGPCSITASIGVAPFTARDAPTRDQLLQEADIAMYDAKHSGGNAAVVYDAMKTRPRRHRDAGV